MPGYRFYGLDVKNIIESATYIECATDESSRTHAAKILGVHFDIEIWEGTRIVGRLSGRT